MNNHMRYWAIGMSLGCAFLLIAVFAAANWYKIQKAAPENLPSVEINRNLDNVLAEKKRGCKISP